MIHTIVWKRRAFAQKTLLVKNYPPRNKPLLKTVAILFLEAKILHLVSESEEPQSEFEPEPESESEEPQDESKSESEPEPEPEPQPSQEMIDLANNPDFSIETIAQQANRISEIDNNKDEVYVSLH